MSSTEQEKSVVKSKKETRGAKKKSIVDYFLMDERVSVSHDLYAKHPATAFLKYVTEIDNAITNVKNNLNDNKAGKSAITHLIVAVIPAIMGHFETYQRYMFANLFDLSIHFKNFDPDAFFKDLSPALEWKRLSAYRGYGAESIGMLLADAMIGWHDPDKVNQYFNRFKLKHQFYSSENIETLKILWQVRHSIAHTGGTLTLADAQKVSSLKPYGNMQITFRENFITELVRRFHLLIKEVTDKLKENILKNLDDSVTKDKRDEIEALFLVEAPRGSYFKET